MSVSVCAQYSHDAEDMPRSEAQLKDQSHPWGDSGVGAQRPRPIPADPEVKRGRRYGYGIRDYGIPYCGSSWGIDGAGT